MAPVMTPWSVMAFRQLPNEFLLKKALWQAQNESLIKPPEQTTPAMVASF
jgi:hypothetical protein